ncbi:MAG: low molecular weight phosphatase family protein [Candidatus Pacearchaeota archaeon]
MNILFVCKHNRFRSKVAEALFRHYYKGDSVRVKSAGTIIDLMHPYVARNVHLVLRERGISIRDDGAVKLDSFLLKWADRIIIVANNVSPDMFKDKEILGNKPVSFWHIGDASESDIEGIRRRVSEIERCVVELLKMLK